ncbi:MAG: hypothetical protein HY651_05750 [Acidobacteria bacterium]|nr:hypothetical protein [Acidobacteriota bacterium]
MHILSDEEIGALIQEPKPIPDGLSPLGKMSEWNKHRRKELPLTSDSGQRFVIVIRQGIMNVMDFSVILGYEVPEVHRVFRLRRYNGKHMHTNTLERETFDRTHIHTATERYQEMGFREDLFAVPDDRYYSVETAIKCLLDDCGFRGSFDDSPLGKGTI